MPVSALSWGSSFQNRVILASSLLDMVTDRPPRDGSEWVQAPSGVEDAWITGTDYTLQCRAAFIPDGGASPTPVSGTVAWQAFLDWARQKNTFRFLPDVTNPAFYVDGCYLVDPVKGFGVLGPDIKRQLTFTIRNPTVDFHLALRGLVLEYTPGNGLPAGWTFARIGAAYYWGPDGKLKTAAADTLRENVPPDQAGFVGATAWLEAAATNLDENNDYEVDTGGAAGNVGATVARDTNPLGTSPRSGAACLRVDLANSAQSGLFKRKRDASRFAVVPGGFYVHSRSVYVPPGSGLVGQSADVGIQWWDGGGVFLTNSISTVPFKAGWNTYWVVGAAPGTAATALMYIVVHGTPGATYSFWTELDQFERQDFLQMPTSPILSSTVGGTTRSAERIYAPLTVPPLPGWVYRKWIERSVGTNGLFPTKWVLGDSSTAAHHWQGRRSSVGQYGTEHIAVTGTQVSSALITAASYGDTVEAVYGIYSDGSVDLRVRITPVSTGIPGAETYTGRTAALIGGLQDKWGDAANTIIRLVVSGSQASMSDADELVTFKYGVGTPPASIPAAAAA